MPDGTSSGKLPLDIEGYDKQYKDDKNGEEIYGIFTDGKLTDIEIKNSVNEYDAWGIYRTPQWEIVH